MRSSPASTAAGSPIHSWATAGTDWEQVRVVAGRRPQVVTATGATLLGATAGGVYRSDDGGASLHPIT